MADGSLSQFKATLGRKKEREFKKQRKFDRTKLGFKSSDSKLKNNNSDCKWFAGYINSIPDVEMTNTIYNIT